MTFDPDVKKSEFAMNCSNDLLRSISDDAGRGLSPPSPLHFSHEERTQSSQSYC